jgi:hypothetical protein
MPVSRLARGIKAARSSTPILCQVLEDGRIIARTATGSVLGRRTVELGGAYIPVQPDLRVLRLLHLVAAPRPGGGADRDARRHGCLVTSPGTRGAPRCACLTAVQASDQFVASIVEELRLARQPDPTAYHWHAVQQVDLCSARCPPLVSQHGPVHSPGGSAGSRTRLGAPACDPRRACAAQQARVVDPIETPLAVEVNRVNRTQKPLDGQSAAVSETFIQPVALRAIRR